MANNTRMLHRVITPAILPAVLIGASLWQAVASRSLGQGFMALLILSSIVSGSIGVYRQVRAASTLQQPYDQSSFLAVYSIVPVLIYAVVVVMADLFDWHDGIIVAVDTTATAEYIWASCHLHAIPHHWAHRPRLLTETWYMVSGAAIALAIFVYACAVYHYWYTAACTVVLPVGAVVITAGLVGMVAMAFRTNDLELPTHDDEEASAGEQTTLL